MEAVNVFLQSLSPVSVLGAAVFLLLICNIFIPVFSTQEQRRGPPGPKPIPLLGNLLQLDIKRPDQTFLEFSKKYGPVFAIYMGTKKAVVLAGYKTVKEALVNRAEEFGERDVPRMSTEANLDHGIVWGNGDSWKEMRQFALSNLKNFGMGKRLGEGKIIEESHYLLQEFRKFEGEAFDVFELLNYAVSNVIYSMVYGNRCEYDDQEYRTIVDRTMKAGHLLGSPMIQLYNLFPRIGKLVISARKEMSNLYTANKNYHSKMLNCLKETLNPEMCRGVADAILVCQQRDKKSRIANSHYHNDNLLVTVMNLFAAGTETTTTTLTWALLFMVKYPEIQEKVHDELTRVIGGRQVKAEDRQNLPFTDAVIHETQRVANVLPFSGGRRVSRDTTFHGYFIEKGTQVIPLLTSVLYDKNEWEKPDMFYPAHFLDKDGKFQKREAFMPFSAGHRSCIGEGLARMELFIFFTTLMQNFHFTPQPGVSAEELDLTPELGTILRPIRQKLCAIPHL